MVIKHIIARRNRDGTASDFCRTSNEQNDITHDLYRVFFSNSIEFSMYILLLKVESEREVNIPNLHSSDKGFVQEHMKARRVQLLEMVFGQLKS